MRYLPRCPVNLNVLDVTDSRNQVAVDGGIEAGPVSDDTVEAADMDEVPGGIAEHPMGLYIEALEFGIGWYSGEEDKASVKVGLFVSIINVRATYKCGWKGARSTPQTSDRPAYRSAISTTQSPVPVPRSRMRR